MKRCHRLCTQIYLFFFFLSGLLRQSLSMFSTRQSVIGIYCYQWYHPPVKTCAFIHGERSGWGGGGGWGVCRPHESSSQMPAVEPGVCRSRPTSMFVDSFIVLRNTYGCPWHIRYNISTISSTTPNHEPRQQCLAFCSPLLSVWDCPALHNRSHSLFSRPAGKKQKQQKNTIMCVWPVWVVAAWTGQAAMYLCVYNKLAGQHRLWSLWA